MLYRNIIIDMNNRFYIHSHKAENHSETILRILNFVDKMRDLYLSKDGIIWFCFDNPTSKINLRCEIDSAYKKNRKPEDNIFYVYLDYLKLILINRYDNYRIISTPFAEADDLVMPIIKKHNNERFLLISEDMDWARNLDDNNEINWYHKKRIWNNISFEFEYGFKPSECSVSLFKTIRGDKTDNIPPGIPHIRQETIHKIIMKYTNIYNFLAEYRKIDWISTDIKNKIYENKSRLIKNWKLIQFMKISQSELDNMITPAKRRESKLKQIYEKIGLNFFSLENVQQKEYDFFSNFGDIGKYNT